VQIDAAGNVTASLSFEKADSAALVKDQSGQLQSAMASAGLSLDSLKITHVQTDGGQTAPALTAAAQQTVAAGGSASDAGFQSGGQGNGQGAGQSGQHAFTNGDQASLGSGGQAGSQSGGQSGGQSSGQPGGQQNGAPGSSIALRSFQAAASAADGVDLQAAYASNLSSRGLDIRI